jgi:HEAT repeat protein
LTSAPGELADYAAKTIVNLITHKDIEIRNLAADILRRIGEQSVGALRPFLKNSDRFIREFSCSIIASVGNKGVLDDLTPMLADDNENVRIAAVEALGNIGEESSLEGLFNVYPLNDDTKPAILEAVGKIGGRTAQTFLINILKTEEDPFIKAASIDSLALSGDDLSICDYLIEKLPDTPSEMQATLLKTIMAIASRQERSVELDDSLRHIAQNAMLDDDDDIRSAGLFALGSYFYESDIPGLIYEVFQNNTDKQIHIWYILLSSSSESTVELFFAKYFQELYSRDCGIDSLENLKEIWSEADEKNAKCAIGSAIDSILLHSPANYRDIIELFMNLSSDKTIEEIKNKYIENDSNRELINDIIAELNIEI